MLRQNGRDDVPLSFLREVRPFAERIDAVLILNKLFRAREVLLGDDNYRYNTAQQNLPIITDICAKTDIQSYFKAYRIAININSNNEDYDSDRKCGNINDTRYSKQIRSSNNYDENLNESFLSPFSQSFSPKDSPRQRGRRSPRRRAPPPPDDDIDFDAMARDLGLEERDYVNDAVVAVGGADVDAAPAVVPGRNPTINTDCKGMNAGEPLDSLVRRLDTLLRCLYGDQRETTGLRAARPMLSAANIQMIFQPCLSNKKSDEVTRYDDELNTRLRELSRRLNDPQYVVTDENILSLLRPLQQQCRRALDLNNTLTVTTPPWSPPQVTTTNSMLNDISRGIDAIRKNRENCQLPPAEQVEEKKCRATTQTMTDYRKLVNHIMNKYSKMYSVHNKDINAHIDQLRFFDVEDGNKGINVAKVTTFWSDAMIRAYGKSLQLRSSDLTRTNFRDTYAAYVQFSQCREEELRARFLTLAEFGFERPVKARYAGCKGNNSNIAYAANVIIYIIENGNPRKPELTPQRIKRKYTLMVRRRKTTPLGKTRRLNEQFIYTSPHEEKEGEELTGVRWRYKKSADDSLLKTTVNLAELHRGYSAAEVQQAIADAAAKPQFSRVVPNPRRKISPKRDSANSSDSNKSPQLLRATQAPDERALHSIAAPNPETTMAAFAALW
jgi:hypothetical protein